MTNKEYFDYALSNINSLDSILEDILNNKDIQPSNVNTLCTFIAGCINDKLNVFNMVYSDLIKRYLDISKIGIAGESPIAKKPLFKFLKGKVYAFHSDKIAIVSEKDGYTINLLDNPDEIFLKEEIHISSHPDYNCKYPYPEFAMVYYCLSSTNAWNDEAPNT